MIFFEKDYLNVQKLFSCYLNESFAKAHSFEIPWILFASNDEAGWVSLRRIDIRGSSPRKEISFILDGARDPYNLTQALP